MFLADLGAEVIRVEASMAIPRVVSAVPHPVKGELRVLANPIRIDGVRPAQAVCSPPRRRQRLPAGRRT
jgi:hypothetical protein